MAVRPILFLAALAVVTLWPQGLVLCVAPGNHADLEHHSPAPCQSDTGDCEDIDSPVAKGPSRPAPLPTVAPAPGACVPSDGPGTGIALRVSPERAAPPTPPVLPILTI
ncbi:MAG: hypothetical protein MUE73_00770 [Planctomycetes bacterium]|jgi:hypothetical protein|nr:hypothetical protein [Planctomycetota bacterium]